MGVLFQATWSKKSSLSVTKFFTKLKKLVTIKIVAFSMDYNIFYGDR